MTALAFISSHNLSLDCARAFYGIGEGLFVTCFKCVDILFQPAKECGVVNQTVLDDFCQPCHELPVVQCIQCVGINQHTSGLVEGANHVFPKEMINAGFATDGRIYLRQQCCRNLKECHATLVTGCREAGYIADNTTAQCDQGTAAIKTLFQQGSEDNIKRVQILILLAIRQYYGSDIKTGEHITDCVQVQRGYRIVGHHHDLAAIDMCGQ